MFSIPCYAVSPTERRPTGGEDRPTSCDAAVPGPTVRPGWRGITRRRSLTASGDGKQWYPFGKSPTRSIRIPALGVLVVRCHGALPEGWLSRRRAGTSIRCPAWPQQVSGLEVPFPLAVGVATPDPVPVGIRMSRSRWQKNRPGRLRFPQGRAMEPSPCRCPGRMYVSLALRQKHATNPVALPLPWRLAADVQ